MKSINITESYFYNFIPTFPELESNTDSYT